MRPRRPRTAAPSLTSRARSLSSTGPPRSTARSRPRSAASHPAPRLAPETGRVWSNPAAGFPYPRHYGSFHIDMASSGATPIGYDDRGSGPATVLLHPFPFSRTIWAGVADALAARRRVITADTRAAADSPETRAARATALATLANAGPIVYLATSLPRLLSPHAPPSLIAHVTARAEPRAASLRAGIEALRDRPDRSGELGAIACPTLVVCGVEDQVTPAAEMKQIAGAIAGARFVPIADAGHLSHIEAPGPFLQAVTSFLDTATEARDG